MIFGKYNQIKKDEDRDKSTEENSNKNLEFTTSFHAEWHREIRAKLEETQKENNSKVAATNSIKYNLPYPEEHYFI